MSLGPGVGLAHLGGGVYITAPKRRGGAIHLHEEIDGCEGEYGHRIRALVSVRVSVSAEKGAT